jgi:predicted O-methyltransferase YrrM
MDPAAFPRIKPSASIRYSAEIEPELVSRARWLALRELASWGGSAPEVWPQQDSSSEVGRLLRVLAGTVRDGLAGEIGTDLAVTGAWIVSGLPAKVPFVTIEIDPRKASFAERVFEGHDSVRVVAGDWHQLLAFGPFSLLLVNVSSAMREPPGQIVDALTARGIVVLDGLTPRHAWTATERERWAVDPVRARWLEHPALLATELTVSSDRALIVATRMPARPA